MLSSAIPTKFALPFAQNATTGYKRTVPLTSSDNTAASLNLGFPPNTALPVSAGGTPPNIQDFNGILNPVTAWNQWQAAGGPVFFDAIFAAAISGYPKWALLTSTATPGKYWVNTVEGNSSNPDTGGANWTPLILNGLGTAAYKATSDNTKTNVAAVATPVTIGHIATFADVNGTLQDGGALASFGTAAQKNASDNTKSTVASVSAGTTSGHIAVFADGAGTVSDTGLTSSSFDAAGAAASAQAAAIAASAQRANNLSDLTNAGTARNNLGLGSGAVSNITISGSGPSGAPAAPSVWFQI